MTLDEFGSVLAHRDFVRLAEFIQDYSGIRMPPAKKPLVEVRLRRRVRELGMGSFSEYCHFLFSEGGLTSEAVSVIDAVTTNKTEFFREPQHFKFLAEQALPGLLAGNRSRRPIKAWSAASSTGAEAYTIAMVLADFLTKRGDGGNFSIFATDICTDVLRMGVRGVYGEEDIVPVPAEMRRRYFRRAKDPERREVRVIPDLRGKVRFGRINLMDEKFAMPPDMDIIFCRNVLIYFDHETQNSVLRRLCRHLRPGGFLFVGHAEALSGQNLPVKPVSNAVFVHDGA